MAATKQPSGVISGCCEGEAPCAPALDDAASEELARLAKALGHPARVKIMAALATRQSCVCGELVEIAGLAQSTVSEHLRVLQASGLVVGSVDGPRSCYCINVDAMRRLRVLVGSL